MAGRLAENPHGNPKAEPGLTLCSLAESLINYFQSELHIGPIAFTIRLDTYHFASHVTLLLHLPTLENTFNVKFKQQPLKGSGQKEQ